MSLWRSVSTCWQMMLFGISIQMIQWKKEHCSCSNQQCLCNKRFHFTFCIIFKVSILVFLDIVLLYWILYVLCYRTHSCTFCLVFSSFMLCTWLWANSSDTKRQLPKCQDFHFPFSVIGLLGNSVRHFSLFYYKIYTVYIKNLTKHYVINCHQLISALIMKTAAVSPLLQNSKE